MKIIETKPGEEYFGFECVSCGDIFPFAGPIDPQAEFEWVHMDPVLITCPHCTHEAVYQIEQAERFLVADIH